MSRNKFFLLFLCVALHLSCQSEVRMYQHHFEELKDLPRGQFKPLPKGFPSAWKNRRPILVQVFEGRAGNPSGGLYHAGLGLESPLLRIYSGNHLEVPVFEFFCEALQKKGFRTLKNYFPGEKSSVSPLLILRASIEKLEMDLWWENSTEEWQILGWIEMKMEMEDRGEKQILSPSASLQIRSVKKKENPLVKIRSLPKKKTFTLSHRFRRPYTSSVDVLQALVSEAVEKLLEDNIFQEIGEGRSL